VSGVPRTRSATENANRTDWPSKSTSHTRLTQPLVGSSVDVTSFYDRESAARIKPRWVRITRALAAAVLMHRGWAAVGSKRRYAARRDPLGGACRKGSDGRRDLGDALVRDGPESLVVGFRVKRRWLDRQRPERAPTPRQHAGTWCSS
jgi:hypothetical protein